MKIRRAVGLIAIIICLASVGLAQTKPEVEVVPDEIMSAELTAINASSPINLGFYRGKVFVLVLWASWCGPCRLAVNELNALNKDYSARGVEVIGLTTEDPVKEYEDVRAFVEQNKIDFKLGWIDAEKGKALLSTRAVVPQILVVAGDHVIVERFLGWQMEKMPRLLRKAVDKALVNLPVRQ